MIDSVTWESVGTNRCDVSPTPYLDSLKKEGLWTTNLYSQGPYTDAATRGLYTGRNVLDDFGYFFKLNSSPITHYRAFKNAGYETIGYYYPYYMMGKNVTKDIDKLYYKTGFEFGSEWGGIFQYYSNIYKTRTLSEIESIMVEKRLELLFDVWLNYYDQLLSKDDLKKNLTDILKKANIEKVHNVLKSEYKKFRENTNEYISIFLSQGQNHILASINDISIDHRISRSFHNKIYKSRNRFFKKIIKNNFLANSLKTMPSPKRVVYALYRYFKTKNTNEFAFIENYILGLIPLKVVKSRWGTRRWQNMPSTRFQLDFVLSEVLPNRNDSAPFFLCLNIEEAHNNLSFFTYDIQDENIINEEIDVLEDYVDKLGTNFKGNLVYYLGLRYMDWCIENFCNSLKKMGLWNNTSILFVADHGSSYTFYPIHNTRVNNFYDESYHIPMLIRHPGLKPMEVKSYQYSKDVLPTFMDIIGIPLSPYFKGRSMLKEKDERKYVLHEYMGPGCPDIMQRPIWFSIRDDRFVIAYKVSIVESFENGRICEVYDLKKDPKCYYNIVDVINPDDIEYLLWPIKNRHAEIVSSTTEYFTKLRESIDGIPINY